MAKQQDSILCGSSKTDAEMVAEFFDGNDIRVTAVKLPRHKLNEVIREVLVEARRFHRDHPFEQSQRFGKLLPAEREEFLHAYKHMAKMVDTKKGDRSHE
jgi:hypothetical protein